MPFYLDSIRLLSYYKARSSGAWSAAGLRNKGANTAIGVEIESGIEVRE